MLFDIEMIRKVYCQMPLKLKHARELFKRPMSLTEKILISHLASPLLSLPTRGKSHAAFNPDRVAMQDATAQMTLLQFASSSRTRVKIPSTVHCDHLILAETGAKNDLEKGMHDNKEVFDFLSSASNKYGIGFWKPGAGIIHQVLLENYAFPGGLLIGTDSHTPNAGGLGMLAIGVGSADAVDAMAGMPWELQWPKFIGVKLLGSLQGWASAKDVILNLAGILTVKGGAGAIIEYFGEGARTISATGKGTICNMSAEVGATSSIFPYDVQMEEYLKATGRAEVANLANEICDCLRPDPEVEDHPEKYYDQIISINLSELEPHVNGPYSPDKAIKLSELADVVRHNNFPEKISVALIGSCTNSSYEDIERACSIARQALRHGLKSQCSLMITPGSEQIYETINRDGHLKILQEIGGVVLTNACGPCIGQWKRHDTSFGEKNSIITSYNRNFSGRNDSNPGTHSFVASPEIVIALALSGRLTFNPETDLLINEEGLPLKLHPPTGTALPKSGFIAEAKGFIPPSKDGEKVSIIVDPESERLQLIQPFPAWDGTEMKDLRVLAKIEGKCTTEQISPAGKWLRFRGHLDNISNNLLIGALNSFKGVIGKGKNFLTDEIESFSTIARGYKQNMIRWVIIGEENYGEGSSREHAAMEHRYLGGVAVIVKSFGRILETNLKKHGMLALTFMNSADYYKILEEDLLAIDGLASFSPGINLALVIKHSDATIETIPICHSYTEKQIEWFKAGSALNYLNLAERRF